MKMGRGIVEIARGLRPLGITTKNLLAMGILGAVLLILGFLAVRAQDAALHDINASDDQILAMYYLGQIHGDLAELRVDQFRAASLGPSGLKQEEADAVEPRNNLTASMAGLSFHIIKADQQPYGVLRMQVDAYQTRTARVMALVGQGNTAAAYALLNGPELTDYRTLQADLRKFSSLVTKRNEAAVNALERQVREFRGGVMADGALLLLLVFLQAFAVHRQTARPLQRLAQVASRVAAGDLVLDLPVPHTRDEVQVLGESFRYMLQRLREDWQRLQRLRESTVVALANAVEAKDQATGGHSDGMAEDAARLAGFLGLGIDEVDAVRWGGILHDVGKIGIPETILRKAGPLDDAEWAVMRQHPEIGARIVEGMEGMERVVPIVLHHHEHYDGSGYPLGLMAEDIPLGARIVSVVDAYHALREDRPYRPAMSDQEAWTVLLQGSGTIWDPKVLEVLGYVLEQGEEQAAAARGPEDPEISTVGV